MKRFRVLVVVLVCALVAASPAAALPKLNKETTRQISTLMDRFVRDVVLRRNLREGWTLVTPDMTRSVSRAAWDSGRSVTAESFPVIGKHFGNNWYATYATRSEIGLTLGLRAGRGEKAQMIDEQVVVVRRGGHWLVDAFYPAAIIRLGKSHRGSCVSSSCAISGMGDLNAGAPASGSEGGSSIISVNWIWLVFAGMVLIPVGTILGVWVHSRRRDRRAWEAYVANRSS